MITNQIEREEGGFVPVRVENILLFLSMFSVLITLSFAALKIEIIIEKRQLQKRFNKIEIVTIRRRSTMM